MEFVDGYCERILTRSTSAYCCWSSQESDSGGKADCVLLVLSSKLMKCLTKTDFCLSCFNQASVLKDNHSYCDKPRIELSLIYELDTATETGIFWKGEDRK